MDSIAADTSYQYLTDMEDYGKAYNVTVAVDGISFMRTPSAIHDMKI
jgi:acyl-coenzyme A thioesterase 9